MFAEIIYETGSKSVGEYANEAELMEGLKAHHERAASGQRGGPTGAPAERIKEVHIYAKHPNDLNPDQTVSVEVAKAELDAAIKELGKDGAIHVHELGAVIRNLSSPVADLDDESRHNSMYKAEAKKVLTKGWEG